MESLRYELEKIIQQYPCRYGIVVKNLATGERLDMNPALVFQSASMIKVPIMYEIMRQVAAGLIDLDEIIAVCAEKMVGGAGILQELRPDIPMTIRELVTLMIILSDNTATNLLIDRIGMDAINKTTASLRLNSTILQRRMMDFDAARDGRENFTTAQDMALIFEHIYNSTGLPPKYGALMLDILKRQQVQDKFPFYLPEETVIAHKTGTLPGAEHDGGIMFITGGPYIVSVMTDNLPANYQGLQLVALIGRTVYEHFCRLK